MSSLEFKNLYSAPTPYEALRDTTSAHAEGRASHIVEPIGNASHGVLG